MTKLTVTIGSIEVKLQTLKTKAIIDSFSKGGIVGKSNLLEVIIKSDSEKMQEFINKHMKPNLESKE